MRIYGLQKMTLLDFPGHVACTVFLGGCDFRCPFCHNYELVDGSAPPVMDEEELFAFLRRRQGLLDGVAVTGGEPCMHPELPAFLRRVRELGFRTKLDTNGMHPVLLEQLLAEGLVDYVAMDIKNSPEKYALTAGVGQVDLAPLQRSINLLMEGPADYEFRTTVVAELHTDRDMLAMARWIAGAKRYFLQAFTDRDSVPFEGLHAPPAAVMRDYLHLVVPLVPAAQLRGVD